MNKHSMNFLAILLLTVLLAACGGSSGGSTPSSNTNTGNGTVSAALQPGTAAQATLQDTTSNSSISFSFPANCVSSTASLSIAAVTQASLPHSITAKAAGKFVLDSGNKYITAFTITANPTTITVFNAPVSIAGSVATTIAAGTTLNVAKWDVTNSVWNDVITVVVSANGAFTQSLVSATLPGIVSPGTYVVYQPAAGTSTALSNLGVVLLADDGAGITVNGSTTNGLQVINIYDAKGTVLSTPTIKTLTYTGAYDIDGQALTPDGSQGIIVDGGNTVRFFSSVQTGVPVASTTTLDVTAYGGDGDSVAIMPNGDEAVVSADSSSQLLVISGITSGQPTSAEVITIPSARDGLVISNDGKVLLASGYNGLTVFSIASITPKTGSLGGTISHSFTQLANLTTVPTPTNEDGRNGMASSATDSSRAVVVGNSSSYTPSIALLTGLTTTPAVGSTLSIQGASYAYSVAISPDGKLAVVGTDKGIVLFTGVDTGTLTQVGTVPYAPAFAGASGTVTMGQINTLGITLDGNYVVVGDYTNKSLLVIPIDATTASGFKVPAGVLNNVAIPYNDQMVIH